MPARLKESPAVMVIGPAALVAAALAAVFLLSRGDLGAFGPSRAPTYRIGVAAFISEADSPRSPKQTEVSAQLARSLRDATDAHPDLSGKIAVVLAPHIRSESEAREFARREGLDLVIWGRVDKPSTGTFNPAISAVELPGGQLWYDSVPAWHEISLTEDASSGVGAINAKDLEALSAYILGMRYLHLGAYGDAVREFQAAVDRALAAPRDAYSAQARASFHLALGRAQASLGDLQAARRSYQLSLQLDMRRAIAYVGLGNLDYASGNCAAALAAYESAVMLNPALPAVWYSRGNSHFCLEQYDDAARDYQEAARLARDTDRWADWYTLVLGVTLCQGGRIDEGIEQLAVARSGSRLSAAQIETENCLKLAEQAQSQPDEIGEVVAALWPTPAPASVRLPGGRGLLGLFQKPDGPGAMEDPLASPSFAPTRAAEVSVEPEATTPAPDPTPAAANPPTATRATVTAQPSSDSAPTARVPGATATPPPQPTLFRSPGGGGPTPVPLATPTWPQPSATWTVAPSLTPTQSPPSATPTSPPADTATAVPPSVPPTTPPPDATETVAPTFTAPPPTVVEEPTATIQPSDTPQPAEPQTATPEPTKKPKPTRRP